VRHFAVATPYPGREPVGSQPDGREEPCCACQSAASRSNHAIAPSAA
jgi:hypothetical protein